MNKENDQYPVCGSANALVEPIQGHKSGFSMKEGVTLSREQELLKLAENGYTINKTEKGTIISKEVNHK